MFDVITTPTFTRTVKCQVPKGDGFEEQPFKAQFCFVEEEVFAGVHIYEVDKVKAVLRKSILHLGDLCDEDGNPVEYSEDVREAILGLPYARVALIEAYTAGLHAARAGN